MNRFCIYSDNVPIEAATTCVFSATSARAVSATGTTFTSRTFTAVVFVCRASSRINKLLSLTATAEVVTSPRMLVPATMIPERDVEVLSVRHSCGNLLTPLIIVTLFLLSVSLVNFNKMSVLVDFKIRYIAVFFKPFVIVVKRQFLVIVYAAVRLVQ